MANMATVEAIQDGILPADEERLKTLCLRVDVFLCLVMHMSNLSRLENERQFN